MPPKREQAINFRATEEEERWLRDYADDLDMSLSAFIRQAVSLGAPILREHKRLRSLDFDYEDCKKKNQ